MTTIKKKTTNGSYWHENDNGDKHGFFCKMYSNGLPWCVGFYRNNVLHGESIHFNKDGTAIERVIYIDDCAVERHVSLMTPEEKFEYCLRNGQVEFLGEEYDAF